ncbi:hypothetical protein PF005_g14042 [Phytophthora fragariae]|uniref:CCHC-type domain-containing protein n=1 Tax=Phytophthora fragariae TaxID=53985 RepID=A0A6A3RNH8_9STRA|nr:hypothetical protein PF003_g12649 [Phytophthora fragariae]KAE8936994.1 hypothetical protein PF009_g13101 [Phytophthora fragariae]KAE9002213.1 hypothetical protein PF011_g13410 [Phytophthora fragariae]KAE9099812.1 hypothetical protein PF007_g15740 [Phytophthora fragariae]KAE9136689.1 hypothetical protein PF006_g14325 [Phytophthora fragariae]
MEFAFADKDVLEYATGKETLASGADDAAKKKFADAQMKVEHLVMTSLSMELGQQVMNKTDGAAMWKYLEDTYEGKTNSATRTNQEIILFNRLQAAKCKPNWDVQQHVQQHVNNTFLLNTQLAALNADMRDPIFTNLLIRSLPYNPRFDRLRGMVEMGAIEVDTPEKLRDQIIRLDSYNYNRCDREIGVTNAANTSPQPPSQGQKPKATQQQARQAPQGQGGNATAKVMTSERFATFAAKKTDKQQGNCFGCHKPGHLEKDCPKRVTKSSQKQAIYTSRVRVGEGQEQQGGEHIQVGAPDNVKEATAEKETRSRRGEPHGEDLSVRTGDGDVCAVEEWCFDNAANVHIVSDRRYFTEYSPFSKDAEKVRGFKKQFAAAPAGHGTVELVVERNGKKMIMNLLDAYHVPNCRNLLSHSQAEDQGYAVEYHGRSGQTKFELWREGELIMEVGRDQHRMYTFNAVNDFLLAKMPKSQLKNCPVKKRNPAKPPQCEHIRRGWGS